MGLQSLEDMDWPPGGDPTAPHLPNVILEKAAVV
jgi:hypothetical protein